MKQMTDEEAKKHLEDAADGNWLPGGYEPEKLWENSATFPQPYVTLDGNFTREHLLAMLHFHPDNQCKKSS